MEKLFINGSVPLKGEITVNGAKNSSLPILACALLCEGTTCIHNCPELSDVDATVKILTHLGCRVSREGSDITVCTDGCCRCDVPDSLMSEMRSSIVFLGAILARCRSARLSFPGGCELGPRPIDLHLAALRRLGAQIDETGGTLDCKCDRGLCGNTVTLSFPSVGATENTMIAAAAASGRTVIQNAAREPEICDLADFLNKAGAQIYGSGESTIIIDGVPKLHGCEHTVIPDRIEAATFMAASAVTGGDLIIRDVVPRHLQPVIPVFEQAGCDIKCLQNIITVKSPARLGPFKCIRTLPYPGFPTDAQAIVMAASTVAQGTSIFIENIFDSRYKHTHELRRMGAEIKTEGRMAVVQGVDHLTGTGVTATDLRGGAALVVAGLCAHGQTAIGGLNLLDRGYAHLARRLRGVGADIERRAPDA
ncbi:MAG: UDP-N-acetylglucosamine 1-carboxyvinyltransferase [Clostridia bacterium]|nr:UDP-N-acetylglucosamine 1-carboxyvinyltransferase [Clostridia bacterium]